MQHEFVHSERQSTYMRRQGRIVGKTQPSTANIAVHTLLQKCAVNDEVFVKLK